MFPVFGMRSLYRSARFLQLCPSRTQPYPSITLKAFNNLQSTAWPSSRITTLVNKVGNLNITNPTMSYSNKPSRRLRYVKHLNKQLASLESVKEHFELFESIEKSASIGDKVAILHNIAKITERDKSQKQVLEEEREKSQQGQSSTYLELLEGVLKGISKCNPWNLANLIWSLGKMQEKDHRLVEVCEKEILSRGIAVFNNAEICQIVNGCANLSLTTSDIFPSLEDAILNDEVKIDEFQDRELSGIILSFAKTGNSFVELFHVFLEEILSRDFLVIGSRALAEFAWSFAKNEFKANKLFEKVEEEIMSRGAADLNNAALSKILWAFGKGERGSKQFFYFLDAEFVSRGVEQFDNALLLEIVWSFTKRNVAKARAFDLVEDEVFNRGLHAFKNHELVLILFSYVSAQRHDGQLLTAIEGELCLRDVKQFSKGDLCQVAWSLGRAGKSDSKLFDVIEAEVLRRSAHDLPTQEDHMLMLMRGFIEGSRGTRALFEFLARFFSTTDFRNLRESGICECAWCFSKVGVEVGDVFDSLEKEIFHQNKYFFSDSQVALIKQSFQKVGRGSKELFHL